MRTKGGRSRYMQMVDAKYSGFVYRVKKKPAFHADLKFLELEAYVDSNGSYHEQKYPEKKWEGSNEVMTGGIQKELLDFLEGSEGHAPVYLSLYTIRHGMYIPTGRNT